MFSNFQHWIITILCIVTSSATGLSPPTCHKSAAPAQKTLNVKSANLTVPSHPFGIVYATDDLAFAAINNGYITVLNTTGFEPSIIHKIPLPSHVYNTSFNVEQLTINKNKTTVYISVGYGAAILDVAKASKGEANPFIGFLKGDQGTSALSTTLSSDEKYAFVSQEYGTNSTGLGIGAIEVFEVSRAINGSMNNRYVGYITLGSAVVGTALSHDGSKLYALSELEFIDDFSGSLSVLDVETLKTNPPEAVLDFVKAGCEPVRVKVSPDGKLVWVTSRASNELLVFDAQKLAAINATSDALVATVQVGSAPVGLTFVNGGKTIITADSNRFDYANATTGLTVVDVDTALTESNHTFPRIPTGLFPREFAVSPNGKMMLVSQYESDAVQAIDVSQLGLIM